MLLPEAQLQAQAQPLVYSSSAAVATPDNRVRIPAKTTADNCTHADSVEAAAHTRETTVTVAFGGTSDRVYQEEADTNTDDAAENHCKTAVDRYSSRRMTVDKRWPDVPGKENRTGADTSTGMGTAVRDTLAAETMEDIQLTTVVDTNLFQLAEDRPSTENQAVYQSDSGKPVMPVDLV